MDTVTVHIRLPVELVRRVDHAAVDMGLTRPRAIEQLLEAALPEPWRQRQR